MYKVNIEWHDIIDHITLPMLIVWNKENPSKIDNIEEVEGQEEVVLKDNVQQWLDSNVKGNYKLVKSSIEFENEEEAILFKTTWI